MVDPLKSAIALIDSGDLKGGQALLLELVRRESDLEEAWMWLAASTERINVRRYYLNRVLQVNPENALARHTLADDWLSRDWLAEQLSVNKIKTAAAWETKPEETGPSTDS
jgi:hypothetical protein